MTRSEGFLSNGLGVGILVDQMTILAVEAAILSEQATELLIRAAHEMERSEAIREKHCLYETTRF